MQEPFPYPPDNEIEDMLANVQRRIAIKELELKALTKDIEGDKKIESTLMIHLGLKEKPFI